MVDWCEDGQSKMTSRFRKHNSRTLKLLPLLCIICTDEDENPSLRIKKLCNNKYTQRFYKSNYCIIAHQASLQKTIFIEPENHSINF